MMDGNNQEMGAMNYNQATIDDEYFRSLPPGYRFIPTDEELIQYYLNPKILNQPLPLNRIHNLNIYKYHPEQLSEKFHKIREDGWYFFSTRERKYQNGTRPNRLTDGGCWKATGSREKIIAEGGELIGQKRVLEYKIGRHPHYIKTVWKMHEYTVVEEEKEHIPLPKRKKDEGDMKLDVVLCKIYINTRDNGNTNNNGAITSENCDQGIIITDSASPSHDREISVLNQEASRVQPLDSSLIGGIQPHVQINTDEGFNHLDHISNSPTIPQNCFYSSAAMSNRVYDTTNYTHYGGSMTNGASGSGYQLAGSIFTQFHHQNSSNYSMYVGQMPSSSTSYLSEHSLPYLRESLTQPESENHEMPRLDGSTISVSLPAHITEYESMLVDKDEVDADGLQYLNIPDEVHEDDSKLNKLHKDDHKTY